MRIGPPPCRCTPNSTGRRRAAGRPAPSPERRTRWPKTHGGWSPATTTANW